MPATSDSGARALIENVVQLVRKKMSAKKAENIEKFIRLYYKNVADEELLARDTADLYGSALSHWAFIEKRKQDEVLVRVYNPNFEKHGWRSAHTVVEIVHDDMPFLVDTAIMELARQKINMHFIIHSSHFRIVRNNKGSVVNVSGSDEPIVSGAVAEAPIYIEIDRQEDDPEKLNHIESCIRAVLADVRTAVYDYDVMRQKINNAIDDLELNPAKLAQDQLSEAIDFLSWIDANHFTFLGYGEYKLVKEGKLHQFKLSPKSRLGLLRDSDRFYCGNFLGESTRDQGDMIDKPLLVAKSDFESTIHRRGRMDVIVINLYDKKTGKVIGERRILGLFTSIAYHSNPMNIPYIRRKAQLALSSSGFDRNGHAGKALANIIETFPRDELFHISEDELLKITLGILHIQERQQIRLFLVQDPYKRYYSCMIYVPRDLFNTDLRLKMQNILMHELKGVDVNFTPVFFDSSILCRIDFIIYTDPKRSQPTFDVKQVEAKLVIAARDWRDDLRVALIEVKGEHQGSVLYNKYSRSFPAGYREAFLARSAASDVDYIEWVLNHGGMGMCFYRLLEEPDDYIRFKLFQRDEPIPLTHVLPILENMGLSVIEERPYEIRTSNEDSVWISDFGMRICGALVEPDEISHIFQEAFASVWASESENDGFNRLVMKAGLNWRQISIVRAYAKYLMQIGFLYSQSYIEDTLTDHPEIALKLVELFQLRFDPSVEKRESLIVKCVDGISKLLDAVTNLDRDRILRRYMDLMLATLRTNFYQKDSNGQSKPYVSFKLKPSMIPDMPKPLPVYEIFVYSTCMEGVHLRGAKVARGGLRWSDRREDFRREVLGLMKAQQVKNSVIVPLGAKGGFVAKCMPLNGTRDDIMNEGIRCYQYFIRGLLDITDNRDGENVIAPMDVVRYDEDDPYLVVAADKGTATFSDIANAVAEEYGFWLGDAFASGGSNGYDHKKMGITARGAWESVKRHFLRLGKDVQNEDFTVVGVGDMAGDVFGNGMLLSKHICLVAAFNHEHIFIDPNPNAAKSFKERQRLFNLPRSRWSDYDTSVLSEGGAIFERSAKSIKLSTQIQRALKIKAKKIEPNQLIQAILLARVELLWNGGIGTYVKATDETHIDVGDRANDDVRVSANDLRVKVIGEGGNLGVTQRGRVEFALKNGYIYTDATDNAAGVDCSDHEVNIKILLNDAVKKGELTVRQRNNLLAKMEEEVGELVLYNNYHQTQAIDNMLAKAPDVLFMQLRLIRELEREGYLDRALEFLPTDKAIKARYANGHGLAAPELSVVMAYAKTAVKGELKKSRIPDEPYFEKYLVAEFPQELYKRFPDSMRSHFLGREIIATTLTNEMMQMMGAAFIHRLYDETGATPAIIARSFVVAKEIFEMPDMWKRIEALDGLVRSDVQQELMRDVTRLVRRAARWIVRNHRVKVDVAELIELYASKVKDMREFMSKMLGKNERDAKKDYIKKFTSAKVPNELALKASDYAFLSPILDIIHSSHTNDLEINEVAEIYFKLNDKMDFSWFRKMISTMRGEGYWGMLASSGLRDDMDKIQGALTVSILNSTEVASDIDSRIAAWTDRYRYMVNRWLYMVNTLKSSNQEFVMYLVAIRGLIDLSEACIYGGDSYANKDVAL